MIDAHVHLWRLGENGCTWPTPDLTEIHRTFELADFKAAAPADLAGAVLVQTQEDPADTAWLHGVAADPLVLGVVGWADLTGAIPARAGKLVGLRPMVQGREADWYDLPELDQGFAAMTGSGLVLDALVRPVHLAALERLARRHPDLAILIDHGGKPVPAALAGWREAMAALAALPNVACKLSGLLTELTPGQPGTALDPVLDHLWRCFGADRLVWGSDWPVLTLAADYRHWLDRARAAIPSSHHDAVFAGNARRIYGLA